MNEVKIGAFDFTENKVIRKIVQENRENAGEYIGINGAETPEIKSNYLTALGETVVPSSANAFIVLGRDRNAGLSSGNGGKGFTGASAIDIIVGHMGARPVDKLFDDKILTSKDFKNDSARIYLSQMADIDTYFNIPKVQATLGRSVLDLEHGNGLSAAAIKADAVRIIARENIKIVTSHKELLSANAKPIEGGIDIIAGCNVMAADPAMALQPMVKGGNLIELLTEMVNRIDDVLGTLSNFMKTQKEINEIFSKHTHQSNKAGLVTSAIIQEEASLKNFELLTKVVPDIIKIFTNNSSISGEYFNPLSKKYINSVWNRVN